MADSQIEEIIVRRAESEAQLRESEARLRIQSEVLLALAKTSLSDDFDLGSNLQRITEGAARVLEVERASLWLVDSSGTIPRCVSLIEAGSARHAVTAKSAFEKSPFNFSLLEKERVIAIHDALTDVRTRESAAGYLGPLGITSVLHAPIRVRGKLVGVLCHEHVGPARRWLPEEQAFAASIADMATLALQADERRKIKEALLDSEARFRAVMESDMVGVGFCDSDGAISEVNPALARLLGYERTEFEHRTITWMSLTPSKFQELNRTALGEIARSGTCTPFETNFERRDGSHFPVLVGAGMLSGRRDQATFFVVDLTDKKKLIEYTSDLENRVAERTVKLNTTIKSLESFCYSIAHDLRAPLRAMQGLTTALREDYGDRLDDIGRNYADRIAASAARMDNLVQDLLTYGRLAHSDLTLQEVDVNGALQSVLVQLSEEIRNRDANIYLQRPFPKVLGHPVVLEQVFGNLLTNALKFIRPGTRPEIVIAAEEDRKSVRLRIQDNGIGIAPEHRERIFRIFERLHVNKEFPGTGIGLAIVQKGIERLGGSVGVESEVGKGSVFWLDLLKPANAPNPVLDTPRATSVSAQSSAS